MKVSAFRQEDVPQLQDHPSQGCGSCDLHRPALTSSVKADWPGTTQPLEDDHGTYCWYQHSAAQARRNRPDFDLRHRPYDRAEDLHELCGISFIEEGQGSDRRRSRKDP